MAGDLWQNDGGKRRNGAEKLLGYKEVGFIGANREYNNFTEAWLPGHMGCLQGTNTVHTFAIKDRWGIDMKRTT